MKKFIIPIAFVAVFVAIFEMGKPRPNVILVGIAVVVFMGGVMWLSSKTPSKNQDDDV